jgi:hypothetical protein
VQVAAYGFLVEEVLSYVASDYLRCWNSQGAT